MSLSSLKGRSVIAVTCQVKYTAYAVYMSMATVVMVFAVTLICCDRQTRGSAKGPRTLKASSNIQTGW